MGDRFRQNADAVTKIALCHNTFSYLFQHYRELIVELQTKFDEVVCIAPDDDAREMLQKLGIGTRSLDLSRSGVSPIDETRALYQYARILYSERPDVIVNFSIKPVIYAGLVARVLLGHKAVFSMITGLGYVFVGSSFKQRLLRMLTRYLYKSSLVNSVVVFFQNENDRATFVAQNLVSAEKTKVLAGTGIDLTSFLPQARRPFRGRFLFIGRLLKDKGIAELVTACRSLSQSYRQTKLQLLGPIDENPSSFREPEIRAWEAEGFCEYLGVQRDVRPFIREADVFVLPSYREGLPRATLEAMAMGKPVVTTDVPGCRETVEEGVNGFLVPAHDAEALADAMQRFFLDPGLVERMGSKSREIAERRFDVRSVVTSIVSEIEKIGTEHTVSAST